MSQLKSLDLPEPGGRVEEHRTHAPRRANRVWFWLALIVIAAAGFWYYRSSRGHAENSAASPAAGAPRGRGAGGANFAAPVVVATAERGDLPVFLNGLGTATPLNTVTVRSRVDGQLINVAFTEGQFVHQGDLLAEIDPRPFQVQLEQAEGQLAKDTAQRNDAQINLDRFQLLFKAGVIPQQQLDTQRASVGQFDGAIKTDEGQIANAKLQLTYCRITAPISGRVGLRLVDPGNIIHASDATGLVVITQLQPISVIFTLPQDQLPQVYSRIRKGAQLTVEAYDRDNTQKIADGKLLTIDNQIDPTTGTYKLKSIFNNENNLLFPNQFVNVHLLVDLRHNLTLVPAGAVQRGPQGSYVYVVGQDNVVQIRPVTIAETTGGTVGLSDGLRPGEIVVTDGQDKLQDGSKVVPNSAPAGNAADEGPSEGPAKPRTPPAVVGNPSSPKRGKRQ